MKELMIWWPALVGIGLVLFSAVAVILERRIKSWLKPSLDRKVNIEKCEESHKGMEGIVRENAQMLMISLATGEGRMDRMERNTQDLAKTFTERVDKLVGSLNSRFDLFDTLSESRYSSLKSGVEKDLDKFSLRLGKMEKKFYSHLEMNGRMNEGKK